MPSQKRSRDNRKRRSRPGAGQPGRLKYETPGLIVQVAFRLTEPRSSAITVDELMGELRLENRRRVQRYLAGLRTNVFNGTFYDAILRLEDRDGNEVVPTSLDELDLRDIPETRIASAILVKPSGEEVESPQVSELLPIYMAFTVLRYLEGIIPAKEVSKLWRDLAAKAGPHHGLRMTALDRKFFLVPYTPKRYSEPSVQGVLGEAIDALANQHVVRIEYYGFGTGHTHRFEPYTLAMYKGGLYLLGKSDRRETPTTLAVERIDSIDKVIDKKTGEPVVFTMPPDYSPEKHFQGVFGIIEGRETAVLLEIQNRETEARLKERIIHPSQVFLPPAAGAKPGEDRYRKARMKMKVRGTTELAMWVLNQGPYVRVLEPEDLRKEVERLLEDSLRLYRAA